MAAPQSLTPKPVSASRSKRYFSVQDANKTLPLVRRIVSDIVRTHEEVSTLQQEMELAKSAQQLPLQDRLQHSLGHLQDYVDELTEAKVMGITPEFIQKAKSHGFQNLTMDKLIQLKHADIF